MAHLRLCNLVCGSISASLITPDMSLIKVPVRLLLSRLRGKCSVQRGLNTSVVCRAATLRAGSAQIYGCDSRERRHGAALEPLAQRSDALGGVGAVAVYVEATESVIGETVSKGEGKVSSGDEHFWEVWRRWPT